MAAANRLFPNGGKGCPEIRAGGAYKNRPAEYGPGGFYMSKAKTEKCSAAATAAKAVTGLQVIS